MVQDDATFGAPGGEPTPTPEAAPPIAADFMSSIIARLARQDEVQKTTNDQLAALVAALTASDGQTSHDEEDAPKSNGEADSSTDEEQPANRRRIEAILSQQTLSSNYENDDTPVLEDLRDVLKRKFESENSNSSTHNDLRTTLNARKSQRISAVDPDPKERSDGDLRDKLNAGACDLRIRLNHDEEDAPKSIGEGDSSADEEQPANRRRIEVILSQQTLSSDDENDDTPVLEDLRDVLKRKFESENSNSSTQNDLRTTLNARKSRRISPGDPNPKECSNGDLRDKLNAGECNLRIRLNRSKPTDLRRRLEQTKTSSNDTLS
ncbi:hypothetical protein DY000_02012672 [Brassica cretica]|uniref:Uncharacterized protein n=1 Tax=Brassica cretica TaxID=69181 RepID=A0ABQ7CZW9_BRACR|nr:hypothetical protein DY000_02012672 [Brassica cretica]